MDEKKGTLTKTQDISRKLFFFNTARQVLVFAMAVTFILSFYLLLVGPQFGFAGLLISAAMLFGFYNVKKGKTGGLVVGAVVYGLYTLGLIYMAVLGNFILLGILMALFVFAMMVVGIWAKNAVPKDIDIPKTLELYKNGIRAERAERNLIFWHHFKEVRNGIFEMELARLANPQEGKKAERTNKKEKRDQG